MKIELSIIIPMYNTAKYCKELMEVLVPQIRDRNVEICLVDDGSTENVEFFESYPITFIRKENCGVSSARNAGLDNITGEYVAFIDSDDLVTPDYVDSILDEIKKSKFTFCYIGWKAIGRWNESIVPTGLDYEFPIWNLCCWNRIYKRSVIKQTRFNELKLIAEDAEFIHTVEKNLLKKSVISKELYIYRTERTDNLTTLFGQGKLNTKRTVYNIGDIKIGVHEYLISEIKEKYKDSEIMIFCNNNEIQELKQYAMIMPLQEIKCTELIGAKNPSITVMNMGNNTIKLSPIEKPISIVKEEVSKKTYHTVIYANHLSEVGGTETFIYEYCLLMKDKEDILFVYGKNPDKKQLERLEQIVECVSFQGQMFECDTYININVDGQIFDNVTAKNEYIHMIHADYIALKTFQYKKHPKTTRHIAVSEYVKQQFLKKFPNEKVDVIYNLFKTEKTNKVLNLVTATRLTEEKGMSRYLKLANMLQESGRPFVWNIFTESSPDFRFKNIDGVTFRKPTLRIGDYISKADYCVSLPNIEEAWCYGVIEPLEYAVPVITTNLHVLPEIGFENGTHGFAVDDISELDIDMLYDTDLRGFKYNKKDSIDNWIQLNGKKVKKNKYKYVKKIPVGVPLIALDTYSDIELGRDIVLGELYYVSSIERAEYLVETRKLATWVKK